MNDQLPSDRLKAVRPRTWVFVGVLVAATVTAATIAVAHGPLTNTELKPTPASTSTSYPKPLPLTGDQPTATPTPTPTETTAPAAPEAPVQQPVAPPAPVQQAPAAPAPHVPVKCPAGTVANAVADNGDESNCQAPCQAYDDNNVCINPGAFLGRDQREEQAA